MIKVRKHEMLRDKWFRVCGITVNCLRMVARNTPTSYFGNDK